MKLNKASNNYSHIQWQKAGINMKFKTIETIKQLLECEVYLATDSIQMFTERDKPEELAIWQERLEAAQEASYEFEQYLTEDYNMWHDAEVVKRMLESCIDDPGATIQIVVKRDDGEESSAELYDHAALVQGLVDALDYFQDEIS